MKSSIFTSLCFLLSLFAFGQQETLFGDVDVIGGFGGPFIEFGSINGQFGADVGGGGALILDEFFIGGYGQGTNFADASFDNKDWNIKYGHGGLWFGFVNQEYKMVHLFSSLKVGWGRVRLTAPDTDQLKDRIFVLTPEVGAEVNLTDFFKVSFTAGYRMVSGVSVFEALDNSDFSSPVGILTFRFGGYDEGNGW